MPRTSKVQLSVSLMFLAHFDFLCDLQLYRATPTWNLFVLFIVAAYTKSAFVVDSI